MSKLRERTALLMVEYQRLLYRFDSHKRRTYGVDSSSELMMEGRASCRLASGSSKKEKGLWSSGTRNEERRKRKKRMRVSLFSHMRQLIALFCSAPELRWTSHLSGGGGIHFSPLKSFSSPSLLILLSPEQTGPK